MNDLVPGLSYLQQINVSHGDIKPSNIFITDGKHKLSEMDPTN